MLLYQLLRPLAYLLIKDASKGKIDILLPGVFAFACAAGYLLLPVPVAMFGDRGVVPLLIGLFQILPGFFLTALAAVATFNRPDMDQLMPKPAPRVNIRVSGKSAEIELTRRRMLAMLFGYLTFICFFLYFVCVVGQIVAPSLSQWLPLRWAGVAFSAFLWVFFFLVGQLIFITMFGLYQLSDRMHQPDP